MLCIILALIIAFVGINELNKKDTPLQIDQQGITPSGESIILWQQINRCFYHTIPGGNMYRARYYLKIILKNNDTISIPLNNYSFNGKKFSTAIDFYAGRKVFGQTKQDKKNELKELLIILACVIVFASIMILILSLSQK